MDCDNMSSFIHKIIWFALMTISYALEWVINFIRLNYKRSYDLIKNRDTNFEIKYLEGCKNELTKIPNHLSIIIGYNQTITSELLTRIAVYALICDISYISFYDTQNLISLEQISIPKYVSSRKIQNGRLLWSMSSDKRKIGNLKYKNGLEKSIEVVVLKSKDGKPLLADVCKELRTKQKHNQNNNNYINGLKDKENLTKLITDTLHKKLNNLPGPELAIILNRHLCTFGLLPWHTGFTEFHTIESSSYLNVDSFVSILYKYSKCEQRYGK